MKYEATVQVYVDAVSIEEAEAIIEVALTSPAIDWDMREPVTELSEVC